jgi:hypothetical protein
MEVAERIPGIHFSPAHWAENAGKEQGRPLIDSTDASSENPVLNTAFVKEAADAACGQIYHPTIEDIVLAFLEYKDLHPDRPWSDFQAWKMDLKGAFTLMSYKSTNCQLFALELVGGLAIIFLCGLFGWTATPAYFQIITRALVYELVRHGICARMYVDDICGLSIVENLLADMEFAHNKSTKLLGSKAIADDKSEATNAKKRFIDMIGYRINLDLCTVSISERNSLRAIYIFFSVDVDKKVPVRVLEKMASLASRYSLICPVLRPFIHALYSAYVGISNRNCSVILRAEAKRSVLMWRVVLCTLTLREESFARPFLSFRKSPSQWIVQFDASLKGIGVLLWKSGGDAAADTAVGAFSASISQYGIGGDSSYQNTCEFIAALTGLALLLLTPVQSGERIESVSFRGDSEVALTWMDKQKSKSSMASRACSVLALIVTRNNIRVDYVEHVPAAQNDECDRLSRDESVVKVFGTSVPDLAATSPETVGVVSEILDLCNPRLEGEESEDNFEVFWVQASRLADRISLPPRQ